MPPKKGKRKTVRPAAAPMKGHIEGAGEVIVQPITETLEKNYMPYAMSVIVSRALPEIDGFKPSHRKLLYTMYKMGLLTGARTKSANVVGATMKLNPHGDMAIYETMVRLTRGNESLLHPYVDSKGNFGKSYSHNMMFAASRYTEVKLDQICQELFRDIDKDTVDFVDNYDNTMKEPTLLPAAFPSILVNANTGIAVSMASSICPFNLNEVCETAIALIRDPQHEIAATLKAPDFPGGGKILYQPEEVRRIYDTGRGSVRVRSVYRYDPDNHCIDITQIPPTTTIEAVIDKTVELVKSGKIKEVSDIRDETGLEGLKITIDLKRGVDADKLMQKLFRMTPLEDSFSCNFNILIAGIPRVMGVREILEEWTAFRMECIRRRVKYEQNKASERLHLLKGLAKILLDIDEAIRIIRHTEEEGEVVPNLMIGFGIDQIQAEYVAEIKLRHLNREYILKRTQEIDRLTKDIEEMQQILDSKSKVKRVIVDELGEVMKKYGQERKSEIVYEFEESKVEDETPDYPVHLFITRDGYFKKVTPQSLRMSGEQKLKEGDFVSQQVEASNSSELLFFTDRHQVYKAKASDFSDTKISVLGEYIPARLGMEEGENVVFMAVTKDYSGYLMVFFENGKAAKIDLSGYATKTNRKKLVNAYSNKSPLVRMMQIGEDCELMVKSSAGRYLILHTGAIAAKSTRDTIGVAVMTIRKNHHLVDAFPFEEGMVVNANRYRTRSLPALGALPAKEDLGEQMSLS